MASSSLTVMCNRGIVRVYGGNRANVRVLYHYYKNLSLEQFLNKHKHLNADDFNSLRLRKRFNKN